mmetsp:Transcript_3884/g.13770  ORF Transcript_3884/g.13770 Transcript_3884/m.13770 type:complete len:540 (-) Transcript_3884:132-1751(-)
MRRCGRHTALLSTANVCLHSESLGVSVRLVVQITSSYWGNLFRRAPWNAFGFTEQGAHHKTRADFDTLAVLYLFLFLLIYAAFLISVPSLPFSFRRSEWRKTMRTVVIHVSFPFFLFNGILLIAALTYPAWMSGSVSNIAVPYIAGSPTHINASIGIHLGLGGMNITLKGSPEVQMIYTQTGTANEHRIWYNEEFHWEWFEGRRNLAQRPVQEGFRSKIGRLRAEYRAAQLRGVPLPIQWIVELFIFDGDGIRFGRYFRVAGYYTTIFLWFGFALWFVFSAISLFNIPAAGHGGLVLMLQGLVMILAFVFYNDRIYHLMPNRDLVVFPFADKDTGAEAFLEISYGWLTYVVIVTGAIDIVAGFLVICSKKGFHVDTDEENDAGHFRRALQKQQDTCPSDTSDAEPGRCVTASAVPLGRVTSMRYAPRMASTGSTVAGIPSVFIARENGTYIAREAVVKKREASIKSDKFSSYALNFTEEDLLGSGLTVVREPASDMIRLSLDTGPETWTDANSTVSPSVTNTSGSSSARTSSPHTGEKV